MTTKTQTPEQIAEQLAKAETEAQRLRDRQAAIADAEHEARHTTELRLYREAFKTLPEAARGARSQAKRDLDALAAADQLDLPALLAAFDRWLQLDGEAGAAGSIAGRLDQLDPLPLQPTTNQPYDRPPQSVRQHQRASFSMWLDDLIRTRADSRAQQRNNEIHAGIAEQAEAAATAARDKAAAGQPVDLDAPPSIRELHEHTKAGIDSTTFDEDDVRSAGLHRVQLNAERDALEQLVREGN